MRIRAGEQIEAEGTVETIRYASDDGEFQVLVLKTRRGDRIPCVVRGAGLLVDEQVKVKGEGSKHRSGELQIEVSAATRVLPANREGLINFLSSSLIEGVGPKLAEQIVDVFGEDTGKILTESPERVREVPGIGPERAERIAESWLRNEAIRGILIFLQSNGISTAYANRIYRRYGQKAVSVLRDNPYHLARDVRGIGFVAADRIARNFGIGLDDLRRHEAGIEYVLHMSRSDGHMYLPEDVLIAHSQEALNISDDAVRAALDALVLKRELVREPNGGEFGDAIYAVKAFKIETELAARLEELIKRKSRLAKIDEATWPYVEKNFEFALSDEQRRALESISGEPVAILTGGPGTGKTTIVRALVQHARRLKATVALAAPTGRAAQRLGEATGQEAKTIHRLLEFDPRQGGFQRDEASPLEEDFIVIDEASMLDAELARALFRAVGPGASLVLVGDRDQLPPVGPGRVLADLIESNCVSVASLNRVFRQGERSEIVTAAHLVRVGEVPEGSNAPDGEFFFIRREEPEDIVETVRQVVAERLPKAFGYDPVTDIQVLVPVHRGGVGTKALNRVLQAALGGQGVHLQFGDSRFHVGDKVMQTRNNYQLETFNGDIGIVCGIDRVKRTLVVDYEGHRVEYESDDLAELELAYAITVHKSQGSEFPAVVMAISTHHYKLLYRKLIYTAMTRARQRLVMIGKPHAFQMAIDNVSAVDRYSGLAEKLRQRVLDL